MAIRYAVDLTDTERTELREIISKNKAKRSTIINAYILLKADRTLCGIDDAWAWARPYHLGADL
jgi:hypothetical protein